MKQAFYIAIILALFESTIASAQMNNRAFGRELNPLTAGILQHQSAKTMPLAKGTALQERIIAASTYTNGIKADTTQYWYASFAHGFSADNLSWPSYQEREFAPGWPKGLPTSATNATIDPSIWYDSCTVTGFDNSGSVFGTSQYMRVYTANHISRETVHFSYAAAGGFSGNDTSYFVYDANGRLTITGGSPNNTTTDPVITYRIYGTYGVVKDSTEYASNMAPTLIRKVDYEYDANGNLTGANTYRRLIPNPIWDLVQRDTFTYDAANKLVTHHNISYGSSTSYSYIDSFTYTGNNLTHASLQQWEDATSTWSYPYQSYNYYNAVNDLDSQISGSVNSTGFVRDGKLTYSYNSMRHITTLKFDTKDNFGRPENTVYRFYYETHDPTSVQQPSMPSLGASLYPNPAREKVFIRFKENPKGPVSLSIYNTVGQVIQQVTAHTVLSEITIDKLTPGIYSIELSSSEGGQSLKFVKE